MPLGEGERRVLLGVGRQHLRLVAVGVRGREVAVQRGGHVEVADLVARGVAHDAHDARLRLAVAVRSQHDPHASRQPPPLRRRGAPARRARSRVEPGRLGRPRSATGRRSRSRAAGSRRAPVRSPARRGRRSPGARRRCAAGPPRPRARRGRTRTSPRSASAAGPGGGPSPGSSRARASGGPVAGGWPTRPPTSSGVADRQHVGGPVGEAYAGARRRGLHDRLGVVGDGVLEALVGGGDAAEGGVVVGAVVQAGAAAAGRVDHPGHERACRPGRGSTAASRPGSRSAGRRSSRPSSASSRAATWTSASTCSTAVTLGSVTTKVSGSGPSSTSPARKSVRVRRPRLRVGASNPLNRMPVKGAAVPASSAARSAGSRASYVAVLLLVGAGAVAVLEVDAQVLDGLAAELRRAPAPRGRGRRRRARPAGPRARRAATSAAARWSPTRPGVEAVGRDVHRVHGLASRRARRGSAPRAARRRPPGACRARS